MSHAKGQRDVQRLTIGHPQHGVEAADEDCRQVERCGPRRGLQDGVHEDIDPTTLHPAAELSPVKERLRHDEERRRHPPVHMGFLVGDPFHFNREAVRRKETWQAGGRHQHVAEQASRFAPTSQGDLAHVPDARLFGIQIGCGDEQAPPQTVLRRHRRHQGFVDKGMDKPLQRHGAEQTRLHAGRQTSYT